MCEAWLICLFLLWPPSAKCQPSGWLVPFPHLDCSGERFTVDMSTNAQPEMLFYWQANPQVFAVVHMDLDSMKFNPFPHFLRNIMHSLIILTSHRNSVYSTWYFHSHLLKWYMHFLILQAQMFLLQFKGKFTIEYSLLIKVLLFDGCYMMGLWWILPHIQIQIGHLHCSKYGNVPFMKHSFMSIPLSELFRISVHFDDTRSTAEIG